VIAFLAGFARTYAAAIWGSAVAARRRPYTETDLDLGQMVDLLLSVSAIAPGDVRNRVVPGRTATIGDAAWSCSRRALATCSAIRG
jgi:hypothetical protein